MNPSLAPGYLPKYDSILPSLKKVIQKGTLNVHNLIFIYSGHKNSYQAHCYLQKYTPALFTQKRSYKKDTFKAYILMFICSRNLVAVLTFYCKTQQCITWRKMLILWLCYWYHYSAAPNVRSSKRILLWIYTNHPSLAAWIQPPRKRNAIRCSKTYCLLDIRLQKLL